MTDHLDDDKFFEQFYIQPEKRGRDPRRSIEDDMLDFGPEICATCNYRIDCLVRDEPDPWYCKTARGKWRHSL